jgi:hypothetical protein
MATFNQYTEVFLKCLGTYQFIEEGIRFCLLRYHATTQFRLDGFVKYEIPFTAIDEVALGRLIEWLKAYCQDTELLGELRLIKAKRDKVAHKGMVLNLEKQADEDFLQSQVSELEKAPAQANACFKHLISEMERADEIVNRAYKELATQRSAAGIVPPAPFTDARPSENGA